MKLSYSALQRFHSNFLREPRGEVYEKLRELAALYESKPNPFATLTREHLERHWMELSLLPYENEDRLRKFTDTMIRFRAQELREKRFAAQNQPSLPHCPVTAPLPSIQVLLSSQPQASCLSEHQAPSALTYSTSVPSMLPAAEKSAEIPAARSSQSLLCARQSESNNHSGNPGNHSVVTSQTRSIVQSETTKPTQCFIDSEGGVSPNCPSSGNTACH